MPAVPRAEIERALTDAVATSGEVGLVIPGKRRNPRVMRVAREEPLNFWAYVWTITHGGRPTLPDEYRIQMTSVSSPLDLNPVGSTVLLGYDPNLTIFAGFDLSRHRTFTTGSPTVQIDVSALHQALQDGLGFDRKANDEVAVGIRPDHLLFYCEHSNELHGAGADSRTLSLLRRASSREVITDAEEHRVARLRRRLVRQVASFSRDRNFRVTVLQAYDQRCAVTRIQLGLIEAAHILPVEVGPESLDSVRNGVALSPTYHRAFDRGLIYLGDDLEMRLNPDRARELEILDQRAGLAELAAGLGRIHLPHDERQWPDPRFIRRANQLRAVPSA